MAKKLINTKEISHEEWLTLRKKSIGGSDAGALVDMNPYQSPISLYADKMGLSKPKESNEAMRLGTDLEDYVARRWMEKTEKKVRQDNFMYQDDEFEFITANIDRDVVGENAGLECKTMSSFAKYDLEGGEVPAMYFAQCQHYMMVRGYNKMYLAILVLQRGLYHFEIERDEEFISQLRDAEVSFWREYIEKNQMPAPDGSDSSMETLKELFPEGGGECYLPNADEEIGKYRELSDLIKKLRGQQDEIRQRLCKRLGNRAVGTDTKYGCSWKNQKRTSVDSKKLKAEFPEAYEAVKKESEYRVFRTKEMA